MSLRERRRLEIMARVREGQISVVKAGELMKVGYRQAKRIWARYRDEGDRGLVHRLRGQASPRRKPEVFRQRVLELYRTRYEGFGPTLAMEYLEREGYRIDHETLRRWLLQEGLWERKRRRARHRQWRERKEHVGELVQMDGSHHDWFEGRRAPAVLMVMIDDASNRTFAQFFEGETTAAAYKTLAGYVKKYGLPQALYVDRDSIYRTDREATVAEQLRAQVPLTQFGRAMKQVGVEIKLAHSPQAKGRVERCNGLFQDRLVKALRIEQIDDVEEANAYLKRTFLPQINRKFMRPAAQSADLHRPWPKDLKLPEVFSWEESRVVGKDWTVSWQGELFQIPAAHQNLCLPGKAVTVRRTLHGKTQLLHRGELLRWKRLDHRPHPHPRSKALVPKKRQPWKPATDHPWRRFRSKIGKELTIAPVGGAPVATLQTAAQSPASLRPAAALPRRRPRPTHQHPEKQITNQKGDILS